MKEGRVKVEGVLRRTGRWLAVLWLLLAAAGCGAYSIQDYLDANYSLYDVRPGAYDRRDEARIYEARAPVPEVAAAIAKEFKPEAMTDPPRDDRMVLAYPDWVVDITRAGGDGTSLITLTSKQYVRDHYDSSGSFFAGFLAASVIHDIFDGPRSRGWGYPGGWPVNTGRSLREGSVGGPAVRGGGLGAGK